MNEEHDKREHILPRFSLDRRITVLVLLVTALVVGGIASLGIPLELIPRGYDNPSLTVWASWNDAPSQEMLDKVTLPLEEELSTIPGLARMRTFATTGFTRGFLSFKLGTDMDIAYREVRDRVERAKARMPDDVDRVQIRKQDSASIPVYALGLAIDPELEDYYDLIENEVILPIQRIDGVASVDAQGLQKKEVLIELDRERTNAAGLNIFELGQQLADDNFSLASGHVFAGGKKLMLRSVARYPDLEALRNRLIAPSIRLKDIAAVSYAEPEKNYRARVNSRPAVAVIVFKEGEANAREVADQIDAAVTQMQQNPRLELMDLESFMNQGAVIRESLGILIDSGKIGAIFAVLVLFFFLRRFRMTVIITLSIPLSLVMGLTTMYFAGETLNIISLLGLIISVGLLVDNSVVVAENIFRLHRQGVSRRDAVIRGAGEISLAIIMATLTTVIVFLPVSLVEGQGQFFLMRLAIPITVSLVASLFVALIFVPLSVYLTLPGRHDADTASGAHFGDALRRWLRKAYDHTLEPLNHAYNRMLGFFLGRRMDLVMAILVIVAVTQLVAVEEVKVVDVQDEERGNFEFDVVLPQSTTLEEAEAYFLSIEKVLEERQEELDLDGYFMFHRANFGEVEGWFNNPRTNDISPRDAIEQLVEAMPEKAGVRLYTGLESDDEEESQSVHVFALQGEDSAQLEQIAEELEDLFSKVDGVLGIKRSSDRPAEEIALVVDRDRAQELEINPEVLAGVVRTSLGGRALPKFYRDGLEIPVRVRFQEKDREGLGRLLDFQVPTGQGDLVSLASITDAERLDAPRRIFRTDKQISRTITLELMEDDEEETRQRLVALTSRIDLPEGIEFGSPRGGFTQDDETAQMIFAMMLSVVFIYLLMGFLFESFILPLSIVVTIPLAVLGVFWAHFLSGYDIDGLGMVGIVLLIGVVVNNGIVLVDYVNRLRSEGVERREAVLMAADRRFRPIMMTALTTVCGMVPLTLSGATSIGLSYTSFGLTLIGGMTTATLLTLLVVPASYTLFDDLGSFLTRQLRRLARSDRKIAAETTV